MGMGKDILLRLTKPHRRFPAAGHAQEDDDGRTDFCLESFRDSTFFDHHHNSTHADHFSDDAGEIAPEERRLHWESQQFLLEEILEQYHSIGSKLREQVRRQIETARGSSFCSCRRECTMCLRRAVVNQLCAEGLDAALCISQWKRTHKTPAGSHEYIEVVASTQGKRKQITFLVELGFRDEFRMAKACDEYRSLVNQLPEIYVGKYEHMNAIIRLMCEAAKKSAEEQKIHMGPWRKKSFMQMKWSAKRSLRQFPTQECAPSSFQARAPTTLKVA